MFASLQYTNDTMPKAHRKLEKTLTSQNDFGVFIVTTILEF